MFGFFKSFFVRLLSLCTTGRFCESLASTSKGRLKCVSLNNQPCETRPKPVNISSDQTLHPKVVEVIKLQMIGMLEYVFHIK